MPILLIKPTQVYVQHQKATFSYSILDKLQTDSRNVMNQSL